MNIQWGKWFKYTEGGVSDNWFKPIYSENGLCVIGRLHVYKETPLHHRMWHVVFTRHAYISPEILPFDWGGAKTAEWGKREAMACARMLMKGREYPHLSKGGGGR